VSNDVARGDADEGDEEFSLHTARRAAHDGRLAEWVGEFLASPGSNNAVLAAALSQRPHWWLGPVRLPLSWLTRLAGAEDEEVVCPVDEDDWEDDIDEMQESLEHGWQPPPLLVSRRDGELCVEDGNHRAETLRRAGRRSAWAIIWFDSEVERDRFASLLNRGDHDVSPAP
jgi:hypothetical protein